MDATSMLSIVRIKGIDMASHRQLMHISILKGHLIGISYRTWRVSPDRVTIAKHHGYRTTKDAFGRCHDIQIITISPQSQCDAVHEFGHGLLTLEEVLMLVKDMSARVRSHSQSRRR